jgi:hypothetical protein
MGSETSKQVEPIDLNLSHPRFANAKFVTKNESRQMEMSMGVDTKEYERWKAKL